MIDTTAHTALISSILDDATVSVKAVGIYQWIYVELPAQGSLRQKHEACWRAFKCILHALHIADLPYGIGAGPGVLFSVDPSTKEN